MLGYSPISAIDRIIEPCPQYDKYFDAPETGKLKVKMVHSDAGVEETVKLMMDVINKNYKEVNKAKHLVRGSNVHETSKKIFDFIYNHIKYNLEPGEILHTPAAVYYHGQVMARQNPGKTDDYPIDCDDMAIMACSFLKALGLPWGLRITSYDGIKYSHVYCVVPGKSKEIIIDPVYIGFNKEKPYKMQKTFIGSTEGMAGIPVYLQSVNGLSGLGDQESISLASSLLNGSNFSGLGSFDSLDQAIEGYLKNTLKLAQKRPDLVSKTYKQPYIFENMLKKAIAGLNTQDETEILDILAKQEKQFISNAKAISGFGADNNWYYDENPNTQELSGLSYRTVNGDRYFNVGNLGFFGRLGLLKKLKNKIAEKRIEKAVAKGNTAKVEKLQNKVAARTEKIVARAEKKVEKAVAKGNTKKAEKVVNKVNRTVQMLNTANPAIAPILARPIIKPPAPIQILPTFTPPKKAAPAPIVRQTVTRPIQKPVQVVPTPIQRPVPIPVVKQPVQEIVEPIQDQEQSYVETESYVEPETFVEQEAYVEPESYSEEPENYVEQESYSEEPEQLDEESSDVEEIMEGLLSGVHFGGFGELGETDGDIIGYLADTLKVAKRNPKLISATYKNPYIFQNMLQRAISGLSSKEESDILDILAVQEKSQLKTPLSGLDSDLWQIEGFGVVDFGGLGLFGRLGLFRKLKQKRVKKLVAKGKTAKADKVKAKIVKQDQRKKKVKTALKNTARIFNKVNPVTVAARNGLRVLIGLNFSNLATRLKGDKIAADKVRDLFVKMGGDVSKINRAIENGSKKKALTQKTGNIKINESLEGLGDFGAIVAMASILSVAGKIVDKISTWIKDKKMTPEQKADQASRDALVMPDNLEQQEKPKFFRRVIDFAKSNMQKPPVQEEEQTVIEPIVKENNLPIQPKKPNYALWAAGVAGVAALAYFARTQMKPKIEDTKYKKLSGIKLK